jgi:hypothetical protein
VREFNLPTVLLSATPYRNDYKSFRVRGRFLFNYPYAQAVKQRIVRSIEIIVPGSDLIGDSADAVNRFVTLLQSEVPGRLKLARRWFKDKNALPRVMVRADSLEKLQALQSAIDVAFKTF